MFRTLDDRNGTGATLRKFATTFFSSSVSYSVCYAEYLSQSLSVYKNEVQGANLRLSSTFSKTKHWRTHRVLLQSKLYIKKKIPIKIICLTLTRAFHKQSYIVPVLFFFYTVKTKPGLLFGLFLNFLITWLSTQLQWLQRCSRSIFISKLVARIRDNLFDCLDSILIFQLLLYWVSFISNVTVVLVSF